MERHLWVKIARMRSSRKWGCCSSGFPRSLDTSTTDEYTNLQDPQEENHQNKISSTKRLREDKIREIFLVIESRIFSFCFRRTFRLKYSWKSYIMRTLVKYHYVNQTGEDEMDGARSTYERDEERIKSVFWRFESKKANWRHRVDEY